MSTDAASAVDAQVGGAAVDRAPLRAGFLGGGFMASTHSRAVRAARERVALLASSSPERAELAARELGVERAARSVDEVIESPEIDVVHVCSPNRDHAEQALAALARGKHVVCEKPLATTAADARAVASAAAERGLVGTVPFVYRYHPQVRAARARIASGETGRVLSIDAAYLQDWMLEASDTDWRVNAEAGGASRAFADIGSHLCDLIEFVTGDRIVALSARTRRVFAERGGLEVANEDIAAVVVEMGSGALGTLLISQMAPGRKNGLVFEVHGTEKSLRFQQERPEELWIGARSGSQLLLRDGEHDPADSARLSILPSGHSLGYQDAFNAFIADVYALVRGEQREGVPTFADGLRAAVLTEAVLEAARTGAWVPVESA